MIKTPTVILVFLRGFIGNLEYHGDAPDVEPKKVRGFVCANYSCGFMDRFVRVEAC